MRFYFHIVDGRFVQDKDGRPDERGASVEALYDARSLADLGFWVD